MRTRQGVECLRTTSKAVGGVRPPFTPRTRPPLRLAPPSLRPSTIFDFYLPRSTHTTLLLSLAKRWMNLDAGYDSSDEVDRQLLLPSAHASSSSARPSTTTMPGPPPLAKTSARAASSYRAYLPHRPSLGFRRGFRTTSTVKDKDQGGLGGAGAQGEGKRKRRAFGCESLPFCATPPLQAFIASRKGRRTSGRCLSTGSFIKSGRNEQGEVLTCRAGTGLALARSFPRPSLVPRPAPPLSPLYLCPSY